MEIAVVDEHCQLAEDSFVECRCDGVLGGGTGGASCESGAEELMARVALEDGIQAVQSRQTQVSMVFTKKAGQQRYSVILRKEK